MPPNIDPFTQTFLGSFSQGVGIGANAAESARARQFRQSELDRQFKAAQQAAQFKQGVAEEQLGFARGREQRAAELAPLKLAQAQSGAEVAGFQANEAVALDKTLDERLGIALQGKKLDIKGKQVRIQKTKADIAKTRQEIANGKEAGKNLASARHYIENGHPETGFSGTQVTLKEMQDDPAGAAKKWRNLKKVDRALGKSSPFHGTKAFEDARKGVIEAKATAVDRKYVRIMLEALRPSIGFEDSAALLRQIGAKIPVVSGFMEWDVYQQKVMKVNQASLQRVISGTKAEPNSQKLQNMNLLPSLVGIFDSDEKVDEMIVGIEQEMDILMEKQMQAASFVGYFNSGFGVPPAAAGQGAGIPPSSASQARSFPSLNFKTTGVR